MRLIFCLNVLLVSVFALANDMNTMAKASASTSTREEKMKRWRESVDKYNRKGGVSDFKKSTKNKTFGNEVDKNKTSKIAETRKILGSGSTKPKHYDPRPKARDMLKNK